MASVSKQPCDEGVIRARPADAPCAQHQRKWVLAATILGSSLAFVGASSTDVALPALQASLGATVIEVQWVINACTLMLAALILPGGALGDRLGRVRVFASGVAIFALASLWCGFAPTVGHLIAARALQGLGGALLIPGSLALISASFPADVRGRAIGLWSSFSALTAAAGLRLAHRYAVVALDLSRQHPRGARHLGDCRHAAAGESGPAGAPP